MMLHGEAHPEVPWTTDLIEGWEPVVAEAIVIVGMKKAMENILGFVQNLNVEGLEMDLFFLLILHLIEKD